MRRELGYGSFLFLFLGACSVPTGANTTSSATTSAITASAQPAGAAGLHPLGAIRNSSDVAAASAMTPTPAGGLPSSADLSAKIGPPGDQGGESSCVGWAVGYATKTLHETNELGYSPATSDHEFSPSWIYNQINGGVDQGSNFGAALNLLVSAGDDDLASFPYVDGDYKTQPSSASRMRASRFKAKSWATISVTEANIKSVIAGGNAVIAAIEVLPDFDQLNSTTNDTYDDDTGNSRGTHAIAIIGYDDSRKAFRFINSWGTGFGSGGYGWIAYSFITNAKLSMDTMVLVDDVDVSSTLLWHNGTTGGSQTWSMKGSSRVSFTDFDASLNVPASTGWRVVGMDDFNADGKADVLWHNGTSGATQVWYMNGATRIGLASFDASLNVKDDSGWRPVGTADFDRDGQPDILWHNGSSGATQVWYMSGVTRTGTANFDASLNVADTTGWYPVGMGDFNRDGKTDILWHNTGAFDAGVGGSQVWYLDNTSRIGFAALDAALNVADSSGWQPVGVTDFNLDGNADIVWHNGATGATQAWNMNSGGVSRQSFSQLGASLTVADSTGWSLVGVR